MAKRDKGRRQEAGFAALEIILALPVLAALLWGVAWEIKIASRNYLNLRIQAEVQHEVQQAFVRVVDDCLGATAITEGNTTDSIKIYDGDKPVKEYFVNTDSRHVRKLVENRPNLPMTGNHAWAMVEITSFGMTKVDAVGRPGLYRIWLEGKSTRVGSVPYRLVTEIYLPGR